jgi:AraC-like DNA-binding protein
VKAASSFEQRMHILSEYYDRIVNRHSGSFQQVDLVAEILKNCSEKNNFTDSIADLSIKYKISSRTLQRYFEAATSISCKQALQIMRIRRAVEQLIASPDSFNYEDYGYYDYSHFHKHLKAFLGEHAGRMVNGI